MASERKPPLVTDPSDPEQVKEAKKKSERRRNREVEDIRTVLSTPSGRRFYWRMMTECGAFVDPFEESPFYANYRKGQRSIGLKLLDELTIHMPEAFFTMQKEAKEESHA
jgi:hypothetical protein